MSWHTLIITNGETCIERLTNKKESIKMKKFGRKFKNQFNYVSRENWKRFFGLNQPGKTWVNVLLPSKYKPNGDGIYWKELNGFN